MEGSSLDSTLGLLSWFIRICKWLRLKRSLIWCTVILGIILNLFATWLFTPWSTDFKKLPIGWAIQYPLVILFIGITLVLLDIIIYLGSSLPSAISKKKLKEHYLKRMVLETETLALRGIPAGLIAEGVQLDEVFIPLLFRPNRPLTDYPLTEGEMSYYRDKLKEGLNTEELERLLFDAEKSWQLKESAKISIDDLWQRMSIKQPAAVIQGFPGMGKSTLLSRLTLHMARRSLGRSDPYMPQLLDPPLIPIFLSLGDYAYEFANAPGLSLSAYLNIALNRLNIQDVNLLLYKHMKSGECLIMLDGLDEISDSEIRYRIQESIKTFILEQRSTSEETSDFNRFLITSRVAGYDQMAFPEYPHYVLAELSAEQVEDFLPRWCRANVRRYYDSTVISQSEKNEAIAQEAARMANALSSAIRDQQGAHDLAENPLLLTLLAVMQQNSIELPKQRVELYHAVTLTLLENRNIAKKLAIIPEAQAMQRLGPLAFQMQEKGNSFASGSEVIASLKQAVRIEGGTDEDISLEVKNFLNRIRERTGLFVQRTGDYYGFFHRTFQEYFAARFMLNKIKRDSASAINELVNKARRRDDLWREPFLLAVAYESGKDSVVAGEIIRSMLATPQYADLESREHDILLVSECLIEAKTLSIDTELEREIAEQLLDTYETALQNQRFATCNQIETMMRRWLLGLPKEAYRPPILAVLYNRSSDIQRVNRSHAILTLLATLFGQQVPYPPVVFKTLIPPLLSLVGLPPTDEYRPIHDLAPTSDMTVVDLALTILFFMGRQGPGGSYLKEVRSHFKDHPEHLRMLARYSLVKGILLTPALVPISVDKYQEYISNTRKWKSLVNGRGTLEVTKNEVTLCLNIHQALLDCAEEVRYPGVIDFLNLINIVEEHPFHTWQQTWQRHLYNRIKAGGYVNYQESIFLWVMFFPEQEDLQKLASQITQQYKTDNDVARLNAQCFLTSLCRHLRYLRTSLEWNDLRYFRYQIVPRFLRYLRDLMELHDNCEVSDIVRLLNLRYLLSSQEKQETRDMLELQELLQWLDPPNLRQLRYQLLSQELNQETLKRLSHLNLASINDRRECIDLLLILLGRLLTILEINEIGDTIENEVKDIARTACLGIATADHDECEARLEVIRYLPVRSAEEVNIVLGLAEETDNERLQHACSFALKQAAPRTRKAWKAIEMAGQSKVFVMSTAAKELLMNYQTGEFVKS